MEKQSKTTKYTRTHIYIYLCGSSIIYDALLDVHLDRYNEKFGIRCGCDMMMGVVETMSTECE